MWMVRCEPNETSEILQEAKVEWLGHIKRRDETENISSWQNKDVGKRSRGRLRLQWKKSIRRDMKAWKSREELATDMTK